VRRTARYGPAQPDSARCGGTARHSRAQPRPAAGFRRPARASGRECSGANRPCHSGPEQPARRGRSSEQQRADGRVLVRPALSVGMDNLTLDGRGADDSHRRGATERDEPCGAQRGPGPAPGSTLAAAICLVPAVGTAACVAVIGFVAAAAVYLDAYGKCPTSKPRLELDSNSSPKCMK